MRVGFSRAILLQAAFITILALILVANSHAVSAQSANAAQQ